MPTPSCLYYGGCLGVPGGALGGCLAGDHWSPSPVLLLLISAKMSPDESSEHTDLPEDGGLEDCCSDQGAGGDDSLVTA